MHYSCALFVTLLDSFLLKKEPSGNSQIRWDDSQTCIITLYCTDKQVMVVFEDYLFFQKSSIFTKLITFAFSLILTAIATVSVAATDLQFDQVGYKWIMIHCGLSALYVLYGKARKQNSPSDHDKMFYNAAGSVVILLIISVVTGELYRIIEFPFLYSTHFHLGCMGRSSHLSCHSFSLISPLTRVWLQV
ncbi:transmembrane protein 241-like isoform X4 [Orbicella faveolata]|uniref:transmembrane protein 241-like isoform X4 n=1 Tax=Orbicella faveolata TaxID=48498 RepID=UPI0009E38E46|nr:transmembrane protein 241-like isoform X4 [Orbicella faveolata]